MNGNKKVRVKGEPLEPGNLEIITPIGVTQNRGIVTKKKFQ